MVSGQDNLNSPGRDAAYLFLVLTVLATYLYATFGFYSITGYDDSGEFQGVLTLYGCPRPFFAVWPQETRIYYGSLIYDLGLFAIGVAGWTRFYNQATTKEKRILFVVNASYVAQQAVLAILTNWQASAFVAMFYIVFMLGAGVIAGLFLWIRPRDRVSV